MDRNTERLIGPPTDGGVLTASASPIAGGPIKGIHIGDDCDITITWASTGNSTTFKGMIKGSMLVGIFSHMTAVSPSDADLVWVR